MIAKSMNTEPNKVYKKNLNVEYTLLSPPQIPIIKNIGIKPPSKNNKIKLNLKNKKHLS